MDTLLEDYLDRLQDLHADLERAIDGLSKAALDWSPGPEMNSIGVLVAHLTGAERFWIGDVGMSDPSGRDREAEFRTRDLDQAALKERLSNTLAYTQDKLAGSPPLTAQELEELRVSPRDGRTYTLGWCLLHALEHTALHLGHIEITRQLWEQRQAD